MSQVLTKDDLVEVTDQKRRSAQRRALDGLGIPYKVRPKGTLLVLWQDVRASQNVEPVSAPREPQLRLDS